MLFISHDLSVVRMLADRVGVLFRRRCWSSREPVERRSFAAPFHPYTHSLLEAVPRIEIERRRSPPPHRRADSIAERPGCAYAGRCAWQTRRTYAKRKRHPGARTGEGLAIRCHHPPRRPEAPGHMPATSTQHRSGGQSDEDHRQVECFVLLVPDFRADACSSAQDNLVVKIHTDSGHVGIGETDTNPWVARAMIEAPGTHIMGLGLTEMLIGQGSARRRGLVGEDVSSARP